MVSNKLDILEHLCYIVGVITHHINISPICEILGCPQSKTGVRRENHLRTPVFQPLSPIPGILWEGGMGE